MSRKVLKYELTKSPQTIKLPPDSKVVNVTAMGGKTILWIEGPATPVGGPTERTFSVFAPGAEIKNENAVYVGTSAWDKMAFHVYEDLQVPKTVKK